MSRSLLLSPVVRSLSTCYYGRCPHLRALLHIIPSSGLSRHLFVAVLSTLRLCGVSASKARTSGCHSVTTSTSRRDLPVHAAARQKLKTLSSSKVTPESGSALYVVVRLSVSVSSSLGCVSATTRAASSSIILRKWERRLTSSYASKLPGKRLHPRRQWLLRTQIHPFVSVAHWYPFSGPELHSNRRGTRGLALPLLARPRYGANECEYHVLVSARRGFVLVNRSVSRQAPSLTCGTHNSDRPDPVHHHLLAFISAICTPVSLPP